mgnify:CR=1 FL=1
MPDCSRTGCECELIPIPAKAGRIASAVSAPSLAPAPQPEPPPANEDRQNMSTLIPPVLPVRIAMLLVVTAGSLLAQPPETGQRRQRGERRGGQRTRTEVPPVLDEEFIRTRLPAGGR